MPEFSVTGDVDPFLHVRLKPGEKIFCESGAMVMMEQPLQINGRMRGGLGAAFLRSLVASESFFQQEITATAAGDCLLSPLLPGGIALVRISPGESLTLADGAFLACDADVKISTRMNTFGQALFGNTGGFMVMKAEGEGMLALSAFGSVFTLDVEPGNDVVIDTGHVVAWSSSLKSEVGMANSGGGFFGSLLGSATSGEGLVIKFSGQGKIIIASRNRQLWVQQMRQQMGVTTT